jgi:hypothetical protein
MTQDQQKEIASLKSHKNEILTKACEYIESLSPQYWSDNAEVSIQLQLKWLQSGKLRFNGDEFNDIAKMSQSGEITLSKLAF